jgi:hypothetical protein
MAVICPVFVFAQSHPMPVLPDTSLLGQYTSRTMNLLHHSTPWKKNKVKILVYGQSISEQEWWLEVKRSVETRFPDADIIMQNKAIGGFSTQYLYKTVEMDVSAFYPDLVLLHVYGNNKDYESVLRTIRSRTAAEVAIMTDHYTGENRWSDTMSYHILPALAQKYKCDIINIRDPWKKYLTDNHLETSTLLSDGTHLNAYGNFLMAELVKPLFCFKSRYSPDPFDLLTIYKSGKDFKFRGDTLTLKFKGNKAEVVFESHGSSPGDSAIVLLDGQSPSGFQGCYYVSRPWADNGKKWPWELPAMIRIRHTQPWVTEEWSCVFTRVKPPYDDFRFKILGSVSGADGHGRGSRDFISKSGRVIIDKGDAESGGDWHLKRSYKVLKSIVNKGDTVKWNTYSICTDTLIPPYTSDTVKEDNVTLFQGISNNDHILQIIRTGQNAPPVSEIRVFKPLLDN